MCKKTFFDEIKYGSFIEKCKKSCIITQYLETYKWIGNWISSEDYKFSLIYQFSKNETIVFEEYLIYDLISMIGSVGGTLGLFIGFSFNNVVSDILYQIKKCLFHAIVKFIK